MKASGISSSFLGLSQTSGQVSHVLLTRSPLDLPQSCDWLDPARLACVKHAASVRPEPGSNSPSKSQTLPERGRQQVAGHPSIEPSIFGEPVSSSQARHWLATSSGELVT